MDGIGQLRISLPGTCTAAIGDTPPASWCSRASRSFSVLAVGVAADVVSAATALVHADRLFAALADRDTCGVWPNFGVPHDALSARRAYDEPTLARLREVVWTYDPEGVLRAGACVRAR